MHFCHEISLPQFPYQTPRIRGNSNILFKTTIQFLLGPHRESYTKFEIHVNIQTLSLNICQIYLTSANATNLCREDLPASLSIGNAHSFPSFVHWIISSKAFWKGCSFTAATCLANSTSQSEGAVSVQKSTWNEHRLMSTAFFLHCIINSELAIHSQTLKLVIKYYTTKGHSETYTYIYDI